MNDDETVIQNIGTILEKKKGKAEAALTTLCTTSTMYLYLK